MKQIYLSEVKEQASATAAVIRFDHVPKVVNIGPRGVDNLSFQPQIDTDLRLFMHDMRVTTFQPTMKPFAFQKTKQLTERNTVVFKIDNVYNMAHRATLKATFRCG